MTAYNFVQIEEKAAAIGLKVFKKISNSSSKRYWAVIDGGIRFFENVVALGQFVDGQIEALEVKAVEAAQEVQPQVEVEAVEVAEVEAIEVKAVEVKAVEVVDEVEVIEAAEVNADEKVVPFATPTTNKRKSGGARPTKVAKEAPRLRPEEVPAKPSKAKVATPVKERATKLISITPKAVAKEPKAGTKQAVFFEGLRKGSTEAELEALIPAGNKATVRTFIRYIAGATGFGVVEADGKFTLVTRKALAKAI